MPKPPRASANPTPPLSIARPNDRRTQVLELANEVVTPSILPDTDGSRDYLARSAPLLGSHEILLRQNQIAQRDGLARIQDDQDLLRMRIAHSLIALPAGTYLVTDERLPYNRRFVRPWAAQFLSELARAHYLRFHTVLQVNSAVRTVEFQQHLIHRNGNAAAAEGEAASPHLTGQAIDLAKHGLTLLEIAWLRAYLLPLIVDEKIDVEEEFQQACFHISVYKRYVADLPHPEIATTHRGLDVTSTLDLR